MQSYASLIAAGALALLLAPAAHAAPIGHVDAAALLAEYVTTCGGQAKPVAQRNVARIANEVGLTKWFLHASWVHLERDAAAQSQFCLEAARPLANLLAASHLTVTKASQPTVPQELDLSELSRRLAGPPYCSLPYGGLVASANKASCQ